MDALEIRGGIPLQGTCEVYGAKNSALPILAATVMVEGASVIEGVPDLEDVRVMIEILQSLGATVTREADRITVDSRNVVQTQVSPELMKKMRSTMFR